MTSLLYREPGESDWHQGSTVNFSHSGVLFRSDGPLPGPGTALDFIVTLPLNGVTPPPRVHCTGRVARVAEGDLAGGGHAVAVVIDGYTFESWHHA
jgi:hypothetical protein